MLNFVFLLLIIMNIFIDISFLLDLEYLQVLNNYKIGNMIIFKDQISYFDQS